MRNTGLLFLFLIATVFQTFAQNETKNKTAISFTIFNENFGLNPLPQGNPLHLGGTAAIEFTKKQNGVYRKTHNLELGYFKHATVFQTAYIAWKPKYAWQFKSGLQLHTILGVGYAHVLPTKTTFTLQEGTYQAQNHSGKSGGLASLGLGIGYQIAQDNQVPVTIFLRQELMVIAPFNINKSLPGSANSLLSIGLTLNPFN